MQTFDNINEGVGFAHGKIILMGEHAVVYGYDAIAWPLTVSRVKTVAQRSSPSFIHSALYDGLLDNAPEYLKAFIGKLQAALHLPNIVLTIASDLPLGAGLGSSAAIAGSITEACFSLGQQTLSLNDRLKWIHVFETSVHGNPSGVDGMMTSTHSPIVFNKSKGFQILQTPMKGYLAIAHSQVVGSTKDAVAMVAKYVQEEGTKSIQLLGSLATQAKLFLTQGNLLGLGHLMTSVQALLKQMGVSHIQVDRMVDIAIKAGALGAKLTGGGLGGCVIALFEHESDADALCQTWQAEGFSPGWVLHLHHG
jgi:mevalonate kinase